MADKRVREVLKRGLTPSSLNGGEANVSLKGKKGAAEPLDNGGELRMEMGEGSSYLNKVKG